MIYFIKVKDEVGNDIILKINWRHGEIQQLDEMKEDEMNKEIEENR